MNPETIYVVMLGDWSQREYRWRELVREWRAGQFPPDAVFREGNGGWRPISELIASIAEHENGSPMALASETAESSRAGFPRPSKRPWLHLGFWLVLVMMALLAATALRRFYFAPHGQPQTDQVAMDLEQADRTERLVKSGVVVPGMTPQQVRRSLGEPRMINATADASRQKWVYRHQTVIFENGIVTRLDPVLPATPR